MTLLFRQHQSAESSFTVKLVPEQGGLDTVLVGDELWKFLSTSVADQLFLSLSPSQIYHCGEHPLRTISCWAIRDEGTAELSIPSDWLNRYQHIFRVSHTPRPSSFKPLVVVASEPIILTEVVLTAISNDAFDIARALLSSFEAWLFTNRQILRQGDIREFHPDLQSPKTREYVGFQRSYSFRVDMAKPMQQGYARKGETRFVLASPNDPSGNLGNVVRDLTQVHEEDSGSDQDGVEINEGFLANSLPVSVSSPPNGYQRSPSSPPGDRVSATSDLPGSDVTFFFYSLPHPVHSQDDYTLYVRTVDLARIGMLNGDWVIASPSHISRCRLVRIFANDDLVDVAGIAMGSAILFYNIFKDLPPSGATIILHASPFGSRPPLQTANNVKLARVASPLSVDRSYQPRVLQALRAYFDLTRRLVKQGDLIAIGIDSDASNAIYDPAFNRDDAPSEEVTAPDYHHPASFVREEKTVFFLVADLEYSLAGDTPVSDRSHNELGCWVNPTVTRMVQVGIEHSRVPDMGTGGSLENLLLSSERQSSSHLFGPQSVFGRLLALASTTLLPHAVDYHLNLSILLKGSRGIGKFTIVSLVAKSLGMHLLEVNCYDIIEKDDEKTEGSLREFFEKATTCSPCILVLRHIDAIAQTTQVTDMGKEPAVTSVLQSCIAQLADAWRQSGHPVLVIGTTSEPNRVPSSVMTCFKHEIALEVPSESERSEFLNLSLDRAALAPDVSLSVLATQTAGMVASDLVDLVDRAKTVSLERAMRTTKLGERTVSSAGTALTCADFDVALSDARASHSVSIGAPKIPTVSWDDVGGLEHVKSDILDTIQLPLDHPELFAEGLKKRSGILLYGPPGTGKTLLAKAVATSCSLNFFSIKGPELLNMYIGESEANVRRVFQRARDAKPCVIFFDELDSVAPKRGIHGDSGGVMDRIVSQLLSELDGIATGKGATDLFVIGATNRPDLLDPALLRPGRFDRMLYLGVSNNRPAQIKILEALTRKFRLDPGLDLSLLADKCRFNFSGADFYALCADAMLKAMSRKAMEVEAKIEELNSKRREAVFPQLLTPQYYLAEMATPTDMMVLVSQQDFDVALRDLVPSVTQSELDEYAIVQKRFSRGPLEDNR